jgi:DMSO/TMAO reductase YedYZ molybdopterin-dependent catalytic subunit
MSIISPGFSRRRPQSDAGRVPPGQYVTADFPVLSYGPTPHTALSDWSFKIEGLVENPAEWSWEDFIKLPRTKMKTDIHCVTRWSKLDTVWEGISLDYLFDKVKLKADAKVVVAFCDGGYTTNVLVEELLGGRAMIAFNYEAQPLKPEHGGPARLLVPHLYFWKSAKWVRGLRLLDHDEPGFWEVNGYNNHGDPWREERYAGE